MHFRNKKMLHINLILISSNNFKNKRKIICFFFKEKTKSFSIIVYYYLLHNKHKINLIERLSNFKNSNFCCMIFCLRKTNSKSKLV